MRRSPGATPSAAGPAAAVEIRGETLRIFHRLSSVRLPFPRFAGPERHAELLQRISVARGSRVHRSRGSRGYLLQRHAIPKAHNHDLALLLRQHSQRALQSELGLTIPAGMHEPVRTRLQGDFAYGVPPAIQAGVANGAVEIAGR